MADLIAGIAADVLQAVAIQLLKRELIRIQRARGNSAEFGILLPQIALNRLSRGKKTENGGVARRKRAGRTARAGKCRRAFEQASSCDGGSSDGCADHGPLHERATVDHALYWRGFSGCGLRRLRIEHRRGGFFIAHKLRSKSCEMTLSIEAGTSKGT